MELDTIVYRALDEKNMVQGAFECLVTTVGDEISEWFSLTTRAISEIAQNAAMKV